MIYAWIAHILPRRLVFACLLRVISHVDESYRVEPPPNRYGKKRFPKVVDYTVGDMLIEWRKVFEDEHKELR